MGKLFDVDEDYRQDVKDGFDDILDLFAKPCLLSYASSDIDCPNCGWDNLGKKSTNKYTVGGPVPFTSGICPVCNGTGQEAEETCPTCKGEGRTDKTEDFKLKVPPGIPDGVTLKFSGKGNAGKNGGIAGSLFITVEILPHPRLERKGDDIYLDQEIEVVTAALGGEVSIPTVNGEVVMKIPAGTQPGKVLKLSGKGGPKFRGHGNGDQYVRIIVKVPEKLSREERQRWEALQK